MITTLSDIEAPSEGWGFEANKAQGEGGIVAKVDELMALLDKLEARLRDATEMQGAFAAAAVHHLDVEAVA